ncbi:MAG: type VI secretion system tip protein VgrG, partial [Staphylococcus hominis]
LVNQSLRSELFRSGDNENKHEHEITFEAIPADTPYHPPVVTPRPRVQGLESAIVVGPPGETIHTDEFGRVKVHFHWDRTGKMDQNATCWIRVSQTGLLGNQILPRVGHEVLVDFLNGDPDRPVIVGRVYNAANMPHYKLPEEKTKAAWRTLRYGDTGSYTDAEKLDTGEPGANELRFEDKGGHEEVFLHAERDMNVRVRWQETHHVGHDQFIKVGHSRDEIVKVDETIEIGRNRSEVVKKDETVEIGGNQELKVTGNRTSTVDGKEDRTVQGAYKQQSPTSIELISGGSSIKIDPSGITLKGMAIKIEGGMTVQVKSVMTTVNASGILTLKGGMTMIN